MTALVRVGVAALLLAIGVPAWVAPGVPDLDARLAALGPTDPMAYFLLAEEVAYEQSDRAGAALARHLYVLSYALDERAGGSLALGSSVCLGLADLAVSESERAWLLALSRVLDDRALRVDWRATDAIADTGDDPALDLATALGHYRAGRYREAGERIARPRVRELLERFASMLPGRAPAIDAQLAAATACRECRNRRVVRAEGPGVGAWRLCYTCGGNPGPNLNAQEFIQHLRLESLLLRGAQRSWSAQLTVDQGEPLRELDPGELTSWFGVDPGRPFHRAGRWTADADAKAPDPAPAP